MVIRVQVAGAVKSRGKIPKLVSRVIVIQGDQKTDRQVYEEVIQELIDNNSIGLESGIHSFKDMQVTIIR